MNLSKLQKIVEDRGAQCAIQSIGLQTSQTWLMTSNTLEEEMETHPSILAWRIPWTKKPGGLQSTELKRVGQDWATFTSLSTPLIMRHGVTVCLIRAQQWFMKFLPKRHNLNLIKMITSGKFTWRDILQNNWPACFKDFKVKKGKDWAVVIHCYGMILPQY